MSAKVGQARGLGPEAIVTGSQLISGVRALRDNLVANQESDAPAKQQRDGRRQRRLIRLAHLPGDAAVPPGAARLLSVWQRDDAAAGAGTIASPDASVGVCHN